MLPVITIGSRRQNGDTHEKVQLSQPGILPPPSTFLSHFRSIESLRVIHFRSGCFGEDQPTPHRTTI
jgi:hypothetical protein